MFKIEKGVPIEAQSRTTTIAGTLRQLQVGDSFLVPDKTPGKPVSVGPHMTRVGKETGRKFTARRAITGVRIWRTV